MKGSKLPRPRLPLWRDSHRHRPACKIKGRRTWYFHRDHRCWWRGIATPADAGAGGAQNPIGRTPGAWRTACRNSLPVARTNCGMTLIRWQQLHRQQRIEAARSKTRNNNNNNETPAPAHPTHLLQVSSHLPVQRCASCEDTAAYIYIYDAVDGHAEHREMLHHTLRMGITDSHVDGSTHSQ